MVQIELSVVFNGPRSHLQRSWVDKEGKTLTESWSRMNFLFIKHTKLFYFILPAI